MCCKKKKKKPATKTLTPVAFTLNVVRPSYNMPDDVQRKQLPGLGLGSERFIQLLEPSLTEETS